MADYLREDYVDPSQRYCIVSYVQKTHDSEDTESETFGIYKVSGCYKTIELAQKKVKKLTEKENHVNFYIVETGKWCGLYTEKGVVDLAYSNDNVISSDQNLQSIMKYHIEQTKKSRDEHKRRQDINTKMMSVQQDLQKCLNILEKKGYIQVLLDSEKYIKESQVESDARETIRKISDETERKKVFDEHLDSIVEKKLGEVKILKTIDTLQESDDENLKILYEYYSKTLEKQPESVEEILRCIFRDTELYKNYSEMYNNDLKNQIEVTTSQIESLKRQLENLKEQKTEDTEWQKQLDAVKPLKFKI